jgi:hypothetical protein
VSSVVEILGSCGFQFLGDTNCFEIVGESQASGGLAMEFVPTCG